MNNKEKFLPVNNKEKFLPARECKKLEQEVKFRLGERCMAFPELWGSEEKAKKEEIRKAAISEITRALEKNDFNSASEMMEEVRSYFGEVALQERESEKGKFEPETKPESGITQEIYELMKESDWERAKDRLKEEENYPFYYLSLASEMRGFDPERFDKEISVSDEMWGKMISIVESERNYPDYFLKVASALKSFDPERFARNIKIDDECWHKMTKEIEMERNYPKWFVRLSDMAQKLDKEQFQKRVPIDSNYWEKIKAEVERLGYCPECEGMTAGAAQRIKPEGFSDITLTKEKWQQIKTELADMVKHGADRMSFSLANGVKNVKVE